MKRRRLAKLSLALLCTAMTAGCASALPNSLAVTFGGAPGAATAMSSGVGVTPGGAQDIRLFRSLVEQGQVPAASAMTLEGLYAEHDLPVEDAPAGKTLHLAFGNAQTVMPDGQKAYLAQIGMSSGLLAEQIKRPPLSLVVVADRSGSMTGQKIVSLRSALTRLAERLEAEDRLGMVAFDDAVDVFRDLAPVGDKAGIKGAIDRLEARGGTDIDAGLRRGYSMLADDRPPGGFEKRILLLTDAQPNVGATSADSFEGLVSRYGADGIGITAFGLGLDFGPAIAGAIGSQRGGNYVFLSDDEHIAKVFDQDFDFLVSPAAYDLDLEVSPAAGLKIVDVHGAAKLSEGQQTYKLSLKTLFFSRNRGAVVLQLAETASGSFEGSVGGLVTGRLKYTERDRTTVVDDTVANAAGGTAAQQGTSGSFAPAAMYETAILTRMGLGLKHGLDLYSKGQREEARKEIVQLADEVRDAIGTLEDPALEPEIKLLDRLAANMGQQ